MTVENPWGCRAWVLTTPRSGSTYLCYLLNRFNHLPLDLDLQPEYNRFIFAEHAHPDVCRSREAFLSLDPVVTKMHLNFLWSFDLKLPADTRFVLLLRSPAEQTASLIAGLQTCVTHLATSAELADYQQRDFEFHRAETAELYVMTERCNQELLDRTQGRHVLLVHYEDLLANPVSVVRSVFEFLSTPWEPRGPLAAYLDLPLQRLDHPRKKAIVEWLQTSRDMLTKNR